MYNPYPKGTDAYFAFADLEEAYDKVEEAAESACSLIDDKDNEIEELTEERDQLQRDLEQLEDDLKAAKGVFDLEALVELIQQVEKAGAALMTWAISQQNKLREAGYEIPYPDGSDRDSSDGDSEDPDGKTD